MLKPPDEWGWCHHSEGPKPPRAHFCHVSRKLVLNMDHFCVWVFNCVGYANYKHFVLFLFWFFCGTIFAFVSCLAPYFDQMRLAHPDPHANRAAPPPLPAGVNESATWASWLLVACKYSFFMGAFVGLQPPTQSEQEQLTDAAALAQQAALSAAWELRFLLEMSVLVGAVSGSMLGWHVWLVISAQTSVEHRGNQFRESLMSEDYAQEWARINHRTELLRLGRRSPYDTGSWRDNWYAVFGTRSMLAGLVPTLRTPPIWPPHATHNGGARHNYDRLS